MRRFVFVALSVAFALASVSARAEDDPGNAAKALRGFRYVLKPALAYDYAATPMSPSGQDVTFALSDHIGWALPIGPLVVSPGASLPIYFFSNNIALAIMADVELHLPLRWVSPYVVVGGGGAFFFGGGNNPNPKPAPTEVVNRSQQGGVFRGGGGLTVFPTSWLGIGGQVAYLRIGPVDVLEVSWPIELRF